MLYLVRHAQPQVAPGVCYGALDLPADPLASRQAAQRLACSLPRQAGVLTSPLQRCELLAQCLQALRPDLVCRTEPGLMELNFGTWEGRRWDDLPAQQLSDWTADFWHYRCGGGHSLAMLMARVQRLWCAAQQAGGTAPQVWITHAGVIRAASLLARGSSEIHDAAQWPRDAPDFGECWTLPLQGGAA
jgi:alpha-ribazole phosphatase